jgi:adenine-specific DNA-methyltransferase
MTRMPLDQHVSGEEAGGELALVAAAHGLGAATVAGWSDAERHLVARAQHAQGGRLAEGGRVAEPVRLAAGGRLAEPGGPAAGAGLAGLGLDADAARAEIRRGGDPLGEAFCALRGPARRRPLGQTFTPPMIIEGMIAWAAGTGSRPARVVDPGAGSARFLIAAGRRWPEAELVGVEIDPLAAIVGRASLAAAGLATRSRIILGDYRAVTLPRCAGPTLFLGNPPYVRHHQIAPDWKDWLHRAAAGYGLPASGLAGLHVHFFLATVRHARPGDLGALITAAEWLDVNYGRLVRDLLLGPLGGESVHLVEPAVPVFADATATSAITCFRPDTAASTIRLARVASPAELGSLAGGTPVPVQVLRDAARWGPLLRGIAHEPAKAGQPATAGQPGTAGQPATAGQPGLAGQRTAAAGPAGPSEPARAVGRPSHGLPAGHVELGELCRVHRGQVTGANAVWISTSPHPLIPARFQFAAVTRARELFAAGAVLPPDAALRRVIDLPADLAELSAAEQAAVARFLRAAAAAGAAGGYVARHRSPWWRVRLAEPPPILASYMARRPPAFVRNLAGARFLNIAHGLYPRDPLPPPLLDALASYLSRSVTTGQGRVYAGGLVKFEPREMERLLVPVPDLLADAGQPWGQECPA